MKTDIRDRWIASLKGGEYKRGLYMLRNLDDAYDPQGVLCELAVKEKVIEPAKRYDDKEKNVFFGYTYGPVGDAHATGLPKDVVEWSGLEYRLGYKIAMMSDKGMKFDALADWIKDNI